MLRLQQGTIDSHLASLLGPDATQLVAKANFNLGVALRDTKGHLAAIDAYYQALKLDPVLQEAHFNLGYTFQALADDKSEIGFYGDYHGRRRALKQSLGHYRNTTLGIGPKADAYRVMEEVQFQLGDYEGVKCLHFDTGRRESKRAREQERGNRVDPDLVAYWCAHPSFARSLPRPSLFSRGFLSVRFSRRGHPTSSFWQ
jgi:tetratricopeptide (TPR) repeat protein